MKRSVSLPSPPAGYTRPEQRPAGQKPAHSVHPLEVRGLNPGGHVGSHREMACHLSVLLTV